jgi:uncharacterized phage protein (TIGR02216 family)
MKIDWPGLMRAGMGELRLPPAVFWALSPIELRIMLGAEAVVPPLTRARLEELAAAYPDFGSDFSKGAGDGDGRGVAGPDSGT